ncbi:protease 4-like, partial [Trifolium medium]|nr:protease 4-like [Trifolium medium]
IACACDEIFAPPSARDEIYTSHNASVGFTVHNLSYLNFVRGLYDNPYGNLYNGVEDSPETLTALLDNIYSNWLDKVSSSRGKKREEVENFINEGVYHVDKLKEEGFISSLVYDDEIITLLKGRLE